jgi:rhodanese-related sulfurtransferase
MNKKPSGAWLIWIHRPDMKDDPPPETDQIVSILDLTSFFKTFKKPGIILFACPQGRISSDAASIARQKGFDAYTYQMV